jgi:thiol-disulfide isomerase/thioredoxin
MRVRATLLSLLLLSGGAALAGPQLVDPVSGKSVAMPLGSKATHLVFFATWCPGCVEELPDLAELEANWSGRGYRLVIVAVKTRHDAGRLAGFIGDERPPGKLLFDAEGDVEKQYRASRLPTHVILDAHGKEVARATDLTPALESAVQQLLDPRGGPRP